MEKKPVVNLEDEFFGAVLNCAVRYAIGRRSYMPGLVIDFITPLIPHLSSKTLWCFDQDVTDARWAGGYGDPKIDEPGWMKFLDAVRAERKARGEQPYKSWREADGKCDNNEYNRQVEQGFTEAERGDGL